MFYSILFMLTAIIAVCGFTSCSDDDDNDNSGSTPNNGETLVIGDDQYYGIGTVQQTEGNGIYLHINAVENIYSPYNGHVLVIRIPAEVASLVSQLHEGQTIENLLIQQFRDYSAIVANTYEWEVVAGGITISRITDEELTININDLVIEHYSSGVQMTISGSTTLEIQPISQLNPDINWG